MQEFRELVPSGYCNKIPKDLKCLNVIINVSTVECGRSFSTLNIISSLRNSLMTKAASSLMFISLIGPPLNNFHPKDYAVQWFRKGHRVANFINWETGSTSKSINENKK